MDTVAVATGAIGGALLRWKVTNLTTAAALKPWSTAAINVCGSFALGALAAQHHRVASRTSLLLGTGFCGAFTTFSTFSVEAVNYIDKGQFNKAILYIVATNAFSISAAFVAFKLSRKYYGPPSKRLF